MPKTDQRTMPTGIYRYQGRVCTVASGRAGGHYPAPMFVIRFLDDAEPQEDLVHSATFSREADRLGKAEARVYRKAWDIVLAGAMKWPAALDQARLEESLRPVVVEG